MKISLLKGTSDSKGRGRLKTGTGGVLRKPKKVSHVCAITIP